MAEPDGRISESLALSLKCLSLVVQFCPSHLQTLPLLQEVRTQELRRWRVRKAILEDANATFHVSEVTMSPGEELQVLPPAAAAVT